MERQIEDQPIVCVPIRQLSAGFTLVEVLIVLLILGIVGMIGLPALTSTLEDSRLREAADDIVTSLEYAQLTAMTTGKKTNVVIEDNTDQIHVKYYKINADLFTGGSQLAEVNVENGTDTYMYLPLNKGINYQIDQRKKGINITTSDFKNSTPVYFDTLGTPSKGGSATVALGKSWIRVNLDALTGKVSVSK